MTTTYTAVMSGNLAPATDTLLIEIQTPSNQTIKIKKIRISYGDGTQLVVADGTKSVALITESVAGTGGSTYTPIALDGSTTASTATVKTGLMTKGTVASTIDDMSIHSGTDFLWQAADEDDKIVLTPGSIFGIVVNASG